MTPGIRVWDWSQADGPVEVSGEQCRRIGARDDVVLWIQIDEFNAMTYAPEINSEVDAMALPGYEASISLAGVELDTVAATRERRGGFGAARLLRASTLGLGGDGDGLAVSSGPVAFYCGSNWLITSAGVEQQVWRGARSGGAISDDLLLKYAKRDWLTSFQASDLANLILRAVVGTWVPVLARVDERLQSLTKSFLDGLEDPNTYGAIDDREYAAGLLEVQQVMTVMTLRMQPVIRPAVPDLSFSGGAAEVARDVQQVIERADQNFASQRESIRASFALIAATQTSEQIAQTRKQLTLASEQIAQTRKQLTLAEEARVRSKAVQESVDLAAAILVVPGLVAAFFAAVPGTIDGLSSLVQGLIVLVLMVACGTGTFFIVRAWRKRQKKRLESEAEAARANVVASRQASALPVGGESADSQQLNPKEKTEQQPDPNTTSEVD